MKKIWRIRKQLMAACLVAVLVLSMIFVPTKKAYAIAGVDDAAFILAMLAAAGAGYVGYNCFNGGTNPQDDFNERLGEIEDTLKDCYNKTIAYILTQGGGGGNPDDFDPDNDDPEKKLTTWEKLKQWWKKNPGKALSIGVNGSVLGAVAGHFKANIDEAKLKSIDFGNIKVTDYHKSILATKLEQFPYFLIKYDPDTLKSLELGISANPISFYWYNSGKTSVAGLLNNFEYYTSNSRWNRDYSNDYYWGMVSDTFSDLNINSVNLFPKPRHVYETRNEAILHQYDTISYPSALNPDSTLTTDAAKKAQEDEEKKDKPVYDNVILPTEEQMNDYINKLNEIAQRTTDPAQRLQEQQKAMNAFVESITNVSPEPSPDPNPNPKPTPDPSPNPDPSPDPDPSPEPDPDAPATDEEAAKYTADLTTVFPFCIPFDLIRAFKVLSVQGEAPVYEMPLQIDYKSIHVDEHWSIDMSDFSSVIQILRVMETLGFIVGLILVTRKLIRG